VARHPVHLTMRAGGGIDLRSFVVAARIGVALREAKAGGRDAQFRVVEFSIQSSHLHLVVEAASREALMSGARGLAVRLAHGVNKCLQRRGRVFTDRYHTRALKTPREVRNTLVYVLHNHKHHGVPGLVDAVSPARWFTGFKQPLPTQATSSPASMAQTWLLQQGWRRHGLIALDEAPA
jgi:putative transposase